MSEQEYINPKEAYGEVVEFTQTYKSNLTITKAYQNKWINVDVTSNRTVNLPSVADINKFPGFKCHIIVKGGGATLTIGRNSNTVRGCLNHGFTLVVDDSVTINVVNDATMVCLFCDGRRWIVSSDALPFSSPKVSALSNTTLGVTQINGSIFTMNASTAAVSMATPDPYLNRGRVFKVIVTTTGTNTLALSGTGVKAFLMSQNDTSTPSQVTSGSASSVTLGGSSTGDELRPQDSVYIASDGSHWYVVGAIGGKAATA